MKKILGLLMLFMFAAVMSYAAESTSTTGTAKAKIIQAAVIEEASGAALDFGTIVADTDGGTVQVTASSNPARNPSGIKVAGNDFSADHFVMSNLDADTEYSVAVDPSVTLSKQGATDMSATLVLSNGDSTVTGVTTKDVYVGGTLTVGANQAAGEYSGTYSITVTY